MLRAYHKLHEEAYRAMKLNKLVGNYTKRTLQKDKSGSQLVKVLASLISSDEMGITCQYENTIINIVNNTGMVVDTLMSNKKLSYMALIGIIYAARGIGLEVSDMANIAYKNDYSIMSVENMASQYDKINILFPEYLNYQFRGIFEESKKHANDKFIMDGLYSTAGYIQDELLQNAVIRCCNVIDYFYITSKVKEITIVETNNACYIIYNGTMIVISKSIKEDTEDLRLLIESMCNGSRCTFITAVSDMKHLIN